MDRMLYVCSWLLALAVGGHGSRDGCPMPGHQGKFCIIALNNN